MTTLLSNASATGAAVMWGGGTGRVDAKGGTWNGASLVLQILGPGGVWGAAGPDTTFAADGNGLFTAEPGQIRMLVSGGPPSGMNVTANRVRSP